MHSLRHLLCLSLAALPLPALAADKPKKADRPTPPPRPFAAPGAPKFTRPEGNPGANPTANAAGRRTWSIWRERVGIEPTHDGLPPRKRF